LVSDSEIVEWMKSHPKYSKYAGNLKLGRILYQREHGGVVREGQKAAVLKTVAEAKKLPAGSRVTIRGIVADAGRETRYEGCAVCRRKNCSNPNHEGRRTYVFSSYLFGDDTDMMWVISIDLRLPVGMELELTGTLKEWNGEKELSITRAATTNGVSLESLLDAVQEITNTKNGVLKRADAEAICNERGVKLEDLKGFGLVEDNGLVWFKEGDQYA